MLSEINGHLLSYCGWAHFQNVPPAQVDSTLMRLLSFQEKIRKGDAFMKETFGPASIMKRGSTYYAIPDTYKHNIAEAREFAELLGVSENVIEEIVKEYYPFCIYEEKPVLVLHLNFQEPVLLPTFVEAHMVSFESELSFEEPEGYLSSVLGNAFLAMCAQLTVQGACIHFTNQFPGNYYDYETGNNSFDAPCLANALQWAITWLPTNQVTPGAIKTELLKQFIYT